jgi:hypothetical protein
MAPLFAIGAIVLIGDRGPLRRLFLPRDTVEISGIGLSWWTLVVAPGRMDWDDVGGVSQVGFRDGTLTVVYSPQGRAIVTLEGEFLGEASRRSYPVPTVIAAAMPTVFEPIDPHHPERGCVRRGLGVSGEPRSAP